MDEKDCKKEKKVKNWGTGGGLYRGVKASVKTLNYIIVLLIVALVAVVLYLASTSSYKAVYEVNGGDAIKEERYKYGETITPKTPTKIGYTFDGWYLDQDFTKKWDMSKDSVQGNLTLYAKWTPAKISVLFDLNGGTFHQVSSLPAETLLFQKPYGKLPTPVKEGYTFVGWQYNGAMIQEDTLVTMNGEHTLKAIFE